MAEDGNFHSAVEGVEEQNRDITLIVVGTDSRTKQEAERGGLPHSPTFEEAIRQIPTEVDYVWILAGRARPRSGALAAMLKVAVTHQVALVGSKILSAEDHEQLLSVGSSTDLFGVPSSGLDESELDFAQYDVIREVSSHSTASLLARRRLLAVLGGFDESIPAVSQGLDFCQRVRLAGGRVVVAPSSRVLYPPDSFPRSGSWRERAGRMRAMFKVYGMMTLAWAIPLDILINLLEGIFSLVRGRPGRLLGFLAAMGLSIWRFPSTVSARLKSQKIRVVGDEDLFRYQISGSVILRDLVSELGGKLGDIRSDETSWTQAVTTRLRKGAPFALLLSLVYLAAGSRSLWVVGLPTTGFSFPLEGDPTGVLSSFAGGWNETGLGTTLPPHPVVALASGFQWLLVKWSGAQLLMTALALWIGLIGASRLFRSTGIGASSSYVGAVVYLLGSATSSVLAEGYWPVLIAVGALPWSVVAAVRPWPSGWRERMGDLALICLASSVLAAASPVAVAVPLVVVVLGWLSGVGWSWWAVPRVLTGMVVGLLTVSAYLWANAFDVWSNGPSMTWEADWVFWAAVGLAGIFGLLFGGFRLRGSVGMGLALSGAGLWVGSAHSWEVSVGGAAMAAVGSGLVVSAAVGAGAKESGGKSRLGGLLAFVGGVAVLVFTVPVLEGGRVGLPPDAWDGRLDFASSLSDEGDRSRVLLIGPEGSLPGMERITEGFSYRLVRAGTPTLDQAWLAPPALGDQALEEVLSALSTSRSLRPGGMLAPFAVRWVVVSQDTDFAQRLTAQADLRVLVAAEDAVVYENLVAQPRSGSPGKAWASVAPDLVEGPQFRGRVRIGDNAHPRWGPEWSQESWWNTIEGAEGEGRFMPYQMGRVLAWFGAIAMVTLAGLVWWGRGAFR
jgi:GT2 family glycosyltransferase